MNEESFATARVTRRFGISAERVFDAWLNPEIMRKWLFTSDESDPDGNICENDARVGGTYFIQDRRGGMDYTAKGEYLEIDRPRRLKFTFQMPQFSETVDQVIVEIEPLDQGCQLTLTQEITIPHKDSRVPQEIEGNITSYISETEQGWNKMFDGLNQKLTN